MSDETPDETPEEESMTQNPFEVLQQTMREEADRLNQAHDVRTHSIMRLLHELNEEQLTSLRWMIQECYASKRQAASHVGAVSMLLDVKFKKCGACGEKHDEKLAEFLKTTPPPPQPEEVMTPEERESALDKYNLADINGQLVCRGCGMKYVSLEDRMLRAPGIEGCESCMHKQRWG